MTTRTLSSVQLAALEADRLSLIVVPLNPQPPSDLDICRGPDDQGRYHWTNGLQWVFWPGGLNNPEDDLLPPYTIGDRIETPHGDLIVTGVEVKRVQNVTSGESAAAGIEYDETCLVRDGYMLASYNAFRHHFNATHGPDAWDKNLWCVFCTVEKAKTHE